jgi:hypothetical protein
MKTAPMMRKRNWERKLRHQSRSENRKALPRVKEGKLLGDSSDEIGVEPSPGIAFPAPTLTCTRFLDPKIE